MMEVNSNALEDFKEHIQLAQKLGMLVIPDISSYRVDRQWYKKIPYSFAKKHFLIPIEEEEDGLVVAICDPLNLNPLEELRFLLNCNIKAVYSSKDTILLAIHDCYNAEDGAASQLIANLSDKKENEEDEIEVFDLLDQSIHRSPIIQLLNLILTEAIQQGASDIHFEPSENEMRVRYRIDGVLQNRHAPPQEHRNQLLTRIKVMAKLDIAEHRLPQDGRMKLRMGEREIDFRVSTIPIIGGERIVLRILDKKSIQLGLENLGMLPEVLTKFKNLLDLPEGIILVTGPTGSGKTTTLYSAIRHMAKEEVNIMTIEDPVEYNLKSISQINVRPQINLDFAKGLRHILRQDPDKIMVGEIRDRETAEIAIQAALTGHLVLSTLHTNNAASTIPRLIDIGIEPYLLVSSIVGVLAQRLVRKICLECKEAYLPSSAELNSLGIDSSSLEDVMFYKGKGCTACYGTGFKGRHGIYELMVINSAINKQILKSADASEINKIAIQNGTITLLGSGARLIKRGITTTEEVLRVARAIE